LKDIIFQIFRIYTDDSKVPVDRLTFVKMDDGLYACGSLIIDSSDSKNDGFNSNDGFDFIKDTFYDINIRKRGNAKDIKIEEKNSISDSFDFLTKRLDWSGDKIKFINYFYVEIK